MGRLYVANATRQNQRVHYRVDFAQPGTTVKTNLPKFEDIPSGQQRAIGGDLDVASIERLVQQLSRYGMIGLSEVSRASKIAPFIFNIDRPVPARVIQAVADNNSNVKIAEGHRRRMRAAIGANDTLIAHIAEENVRVEREQALNAAPPLELEIEQEDGEVEGMKRIAEGFRMDRSAPQAKPARSKPGRPARAKA